MVRIGVTGLMASGKSTVARRFAARGAALVEGDALGWMVLRRPSVRDALLARFGPDVKGADGEVDRARLGRIVFGAPAAMEALNAIVQPDLRRLVWEEVAGAEGRVVVLDAALLTLWRLEPELDGVVEVTAPEGIRVARLRAARGFPEEEARARIGGQALPPVEGARRHWIIENAGDLASLERRADAVWEEIAALARA